MSSEPRSKDEGLPPGEDDFLVEQLEIFSEIFGSPIGMIDAASSAAPPEKKKTLWFEPPAPPQKPFDNTKRAGLPTILEAPRPGVDNPVAEKAPSESVKLPVVPAPPIAPAEADPSEVRLMKPDKIVTPAPQPVVDYQVIEKTPSKSVELPVVPAPPIVPAESDPPRIRRAKAGKAETSSFLGECESIWRHLRDRWFER